MSEHCVIQEFGYSIAVDARQVSSTGGPTKEATNLRSLNGNFETYEIPTDPRPGGDRLPLRPLIVLSVVLALIIGAVVYLQKKPSKLGGHPAVAGTSVPAGNAGTGRLPSNQPVVPVGLRGDALDHTRSVERLLNYAVQDLSAANASLEKVRPYARSEVDVADEKVQRAGRDLELARRHMEIVQALIASK